MTEPEPPQFLVLAADLGETGGIGTAMRDLVRVLVAEYGGDRCHVMSVRDSGNIEALGAHVVDRGVKTASEAVPVARQVRFSIGAVRSAWRYRRGLVVIAAHPHLAPVAWAAARAARAPFLAWVIGIESWLPLPPHIRASLQRATRVVSISEFTARHAIDAQGLSADRVTVVHLALSAHRVSTPANRDRNKVLTVSRLSPADEYKGVDTLVRVWPSVLAEAPEASLTVIGGGEGLDHFRGLAKANGVDGAITFLGRVSDAELHAAYGTAGVFALPSRCRITPPRAEGEGFGLVFVEAAAAGLPVVGGRAGATVEVVLDNETGLLVDPEDDAAVAAAIVRLIADPALARRLGDRGAAFARERFSIEMFRTAVLSVVERVVRDGGA